MAHLMKAEGSSPDSCDICGMRPKQHKIHDRDKCVCVHGDAKILEVINRELKISKAAVSTGGKVTVDAVTVGRMAFTKYGKTPVPGASAPKAKVGQKTTMALTAATGVLTLADGIMTIVDAVTDKNPQERCSKCSKTFQAPGCILLCSACGSECIDKDWRKGSSDGKCCYNVCADCFGGLVGN